MEPPGLGCFSSHRRNSGPANAQLALLDFVSIEQVTIPPLNNHLNTDLKPPTKWFLRGKPLDLGRLIHVQPLIGFAFELVTDHTIFAAAFC
jgi:hypothetical protein